MKVTKYVNAESYDAPKHSSMVAYRLQGLEASDCQSFSVGHSHFLPGGGAELSASAVERVYVVTSGKVTVTSGTQTESLEALDSCFIPVGEKRKVINESHEPASMLVIVQSQA